MDINLKSTLKIGFVAVTSLAMLTQCGKHENTRQKTSTAMMELNPNWTNK